MATHHLTQRPPQYHHQHPQHPYHQQQQQQQHQFQSRHPPVTPSKRVFDAFYADLNDAIASGLTLLDMDSARRTSRSGQRWAFGCMSRLRELACSDLLVVLQCAALVEQCTALHTIAFHDRREPTWRVIQTLTALVTRNRGTLRRLCMVSCKYQKASSASFGAALGDCRALQTVEVNCFDGLTYDAFLYALQRRGAPPAPTAGPARPRALEAAAAAPPSALRELKWGEQTMDDRAYAPLYDAGVRLEAAEVHTRHSLSGLAAHPIQRLRFYLVAGHATVSAALNALNPTLTALTMENFQLPAHRWTTPVDLPPTLTRLALLGHAASFVRTAPGLRALECYGYAAVDRLPTLLRSLVDPHSLKELRMFCSTEATGATLRDLADLAPGLLRLRLDSVTLPLIAQFAADALAAHAAPWPLLAEFVCSLLVVDIQPSSAVAGGVERYLQLWPRLTSLVVLDTGTASGAAEAWIDGFGSAMYARMTDKVASHTCLAPCGAKNGVRESGPSAPIAVAAASDCPAPLRRLALSTALWIGTTLRTANRYMGALTELRVHRCDAGAGDALLRRVLELNCCSLVSLAVVNTLPLAEVMANLPVLSALRQLHIPYYDRAGARALVAAAPNLRHLTLDAFRRARLLLEDSKELARLQTLNFQGFLFSPKEASLWRQLAAQVPAATRGYTWQHATELNGEGLARYN